MAARVSSLPVFAALALLIACGDGDGPKNLSHDAQAVTTDAKPEESDAGPGEEIDATVDDPEPAEDTGVEPALDAEVLDGASETDASELDASVPDGDDGGEPDTSVTPDAEQPDADIDLPPHPLTGKYAARTQLYARQHSAVALEPGTDPTPFDFVSKAVLYSVVEIDPAGMAHEQYCFLEVANELVASWTNPTAVLRVPPSAVLLQTQGDRVVRPLEAHSVALSWDPEQTPADCVAGQPHSSGCTCPNGDELPQLPNDCRVTDLDQDGVPGTDMYVLLGSSPETLEGDDASVILSVAARVRMGWDLPATPGEQIKGKIRGGFEQRELSRENLLGIDIEPILNAMCSEELGHIELRKGQFDCATLMARRATDKVSYDLFDPSLDQPQPAVEECPDPTQVCEGTRDECGECNGPGIPAGKCDCAGHELDECGKCNGTGIKPGTCACNDDTPAPTWYQDSDGDGKGDPAQSVQACTQPAGYVDNDSDTAPNCNGAPDECGVCNGNGKPANACDCTGKGPTAWYEDKDGDGKGDPAIALENCTQPDGFVDNATDEDPGCATPRDTCGVCGGDGLPEGQCCPGVVLDECGECGGPGKPANACDCDGTAPRAWYEDADGDGKGNPAITVLACTQPTGFVDNALDTDPSCGGSKDECGVCNGPGIPAGKCDCQGTAPDACNVCGGDNSTCAGCDGVPNSGKVKDACGVCGGDNSTCAGCDGAAGSGKVVDACGVCGGSGIPAGKCDCQGTLPGTWFADLDGDGLGDPNAPTLSCTQPAGHVANANDPYPACNGVPDVCNKCNGPGFPADTCDCAGTAKKLWYEDADADGLGDPAKSKQECTQPAGYVDNPNDPHPSCKGTPDTCGVCNGPGVPAGKCNCAGAVADECGVCGGTGKPADTCDCAGTLPKLWYADTDGDGKGDPAVSQSACTAPAGYVGNATDTDPSCGSARDACGKCGGSATTCPILGTYAVRSIVFTKGKSGTQTTAAKAINYTLTKISLSADGRSVEAREQSCYSESLPLAGENVYSWSKPEWMQKIPPVTTTLTSNPDGTWTRADPSYTLGWLRSRRPGTCNDASPSGTATPQPSTADAIWPTASAGNLCTCNLSSDTLPPFNKSTRYDCRLIDADQDGYPGVSVFGSLSAPATPSSDAGGLTWGRLMIASLPNSRWTITTASDRNHTAIVNDAGKSSVVGCVGGGLISACSAVSGQPSGSVCPERFNKAAFKPVAADYTCNQVVSNRDTLFTAANDGSLPDNNACPPPP